MPERIYTWLVAAVLALAVPLPGQIRGAAATPSGTILTWGDQVTEWTQGAPRVLVGRAGFGEGGCLVPGGLAVAERPGLGPMIRLTLGSERREVIEPATEFSDCLWTALFGRPGVLVIHRFAQVRFYEPPAKAGEPWPYREVYSIYTASRQGGLLRQDVDGDGLPDFFVGNYWMRSPARFDLPWRIFAINLYHETESAALARVALFRGRDLIWAERTGRRVTWFERPADEREQWTAHPLELGVEEPSGLAVAGESVYVGDRDQILRWNQDKVETLATGFRTVQLFLIGGNLWAVTRDGVRRVPQRRK